MEYELINRIYDTLMQNTKHEQFDISIIDDSELNGLNGTIDFSIGKNTYQLKLNKIYTSR